MFRFMFIFLAFFSTAFCGLREDLIDDLSIWVIRLESKIDQAENKDYERGKIDALLIVLDHLYKSENVGTNHF